MSLISATSFIDDLLSDPEIGPRVAHIERMPARTAQWAALPADLDPALVAALASRGVDRLYSHQAMAYDLARSGRDFVVVTPTASGKTLCYNLPVLQGIIEEPETRALYLFPTKALAQDQMHEVHSLISDLCGKHSLSHFSPTSGFFILFKMLLSLGDGGLLREAVIPPWHRSKPLVFTKGTNWKTCRRNRVSHGRFSSSWAALFTV